MLDAPARPAYLSLLNPSSTKRRINSATLMPVRLDALFSLLICIGVSQIVVRFMVVEVLRYAIHMSRTIFEGIWPERPCLCISLGITSAGFIRRYAQLLLWQRGLLLPFGPF